VPDLFQMSDMVLVLAAFLVAAANASVGTTGGLLLAILATAVPAPVAVPLHAVIETVSNGFGWVRLKADVSMQMIIAFGAGSLLSVGLAAPFTQAVPPHVMAILLGCFLFWACWWPAPNPGRRFSFRLAVAGVMTGALTPFVGATGPLAQPFFAGEPAKRRTVLASHTAGMAIQHGLKVVAFVVLGFAFVPYLPLLAALVVAGMAGTWLGLKRRVKIPPLVFGLGIKLLVSVLALRLVVTGAGWL
jgi:uncharacterized membrane protein YfcA